MIRRCYRTHPGSILGTSFFTIIITMAVTYSEEATRNHPLGPGSQQKLSYTCLLIFQARLSPVNVTIMELVPCKGVIFYVIWAKVAK